VPLTLLCLHGWGGTRESFHELKGALHGSDITVLAPDLPGFGSQPEPPQPWTNNDYADWVMQWMAANGQRPTANEPWALLGHSHGGRVAIKLVTGKLQAAGIALPSHLFLCAPAGIRRGQYLRRAVGWVLAKTGKLLLGFPLAISRIQPVARRLLYRLLRTHDYETASPAMRRTMVLVTSENLRPVLGGITVPTDLFWGEDDRITPLRDGQLAQRAINGSTLHTYPSVRHRVHRERAREIAAIIRSHLSAGR
jgi:pimeloyl-ACP methyl ester carboxylesterase